MVTGLIYCCLFFLSMSHIDPSICHENRNIFLLYALDSLRTINFEKDLQSP